MTAPADMPRDSAYRFSTIRPIFADNDGDALAMFIDQVSAGQVAISLSRDDAYDADSIPIAAAAAAMSPTQRVRLAQWLLPDPETLSAHDRRNAARRLEKLREKYLAPDAAP